jgi:hypothetical protein
MGYGFTTINPNYPIYQFLNMSLEETFKMFGQHEYLGVKFNIGRVHINGTFIYKLVLTLVPKNQIAW